MLKLDPKTLPETGAKYKLGLKIGGGVGGEVFEAVENETGKKVAIKVIELKKDTEDEIQREYHVLKQMSGNDNFPEFYGIYLKKGKDNVQKVWLVMELCEGGDAKSLVRKLEQENKKMSEKHIAYIIRETIKVTLLNLSPTLALANPFATVIFTTHFHGKTQVELRTNIFHINAKKHCRHLERKLAVIHLHENNIRHGDIRGSNILLTTDGRVKLIDYGISKWVEKDKKIKTCVGSPSWLAPEMIKSQTEEGSLRFDEKADVWALGITAIELGDGQAPFEDIYPGRALFQIVKNPPPTMRKPSEWSQFYNDFISECLIKPPENRPFVQELLVHPFFETLNQKENLLLDIKALLKRYKNIDLYKKQDVMVQNGFLKIEERSALEKILQEDLADMNKISEDSVLFELHERLKKNEFHTFIGEVLLILNSNKISNAYGTQYHEKYRFKVKSQNAPHIYSTADSAYRDAFHHEKSQHILFAGETRAGKTTNMMHALDHLLYLGRGLECSGKIPKALNVIHTMGNAMTPHNKDSTRHVLQTQLTFTDTGKTSGAIFRLNLLEKEKVTTTTQTQKNFHLFYYFYDAIKSENKQTEFNLTKENYKFLQTDANSRSKQSRTSDYQTFENNLLELGFEEHHMQAIKKILAAIILLGEVEFLEDEDGNGVLGSPEIIKSIADLLEVDKKKLSWAFLNYCLFVNGEAIMRQNSKQEADEAKNVLARGLYSRMVDWVVNTINENISVSRVIYGDRHVISLLDLYGFECYKQNTLNQLFVNTINEQMQFHYNQKIFAWDKQTAEEDGVPFPNLEFNDNKTVMDLIMSKPDGLLYKLDETSRNEASSNLMDILITEKGAPIVVETSRNFSINHFTGKIIYDASEMPEKNRDFLPPEIIETMRLSKQEVIKQLFSSLLSKSGNLSKEPKERRESEIPTESKKKGEKTVHTTSWGKYSQSRQMRTAATTFRGACADIIKSLMKKDFGFHFVRCIRTDLSNKPGAFDPEVVRQQLRALAVVNTIAATQRGYSYSVSCVDFIRRYKFLAFDFDENVEETTDNCRLLLLRLKLEGWTMGKTKVFLKYFNKEYLSRLYETQIKKIVKVQSMMRAFMARRKLYAKIRRYQVDADKKNSLVEDEQDSLLEANAARIIQKRFREHMTKKCNLTESQKEFIRRWYKRWRAKSIFQVLLQYRAEKLQGLVNFCLQIHLYNQKFLNDIQKTKGAINLEKVDVNAKPTKYLPPLKFSTPKLPFTWESFILRGANYNGEPLPDCNVEQLAAQVNANLSKNIKSQEKTSKNYEEKEIQTVNDENLPRNIKTKQTQTEEQKENVNSTESLKVKKKQSIKNLTNKTEVIKESKDANDSASAGENNKKINPELWYSNNRPSPIKPRVDTETKFLISISEIEEKFKNQNYKEEGDDPPFNFRALLKKTNRFPVRQRSSQGGLTFQREIANFNFDEKKSQTNGDLNKPRRDSETIKMELAPGITIIGKITNL